MFYGLALHVPLKFQFLDAGSSWVYFCCRLISNIRVRLVSHVCLQQLINDNLPRLISVFVMQISQSVGVRWIMPEVIVWRIESKRRARIPASTADVAVKRTTKARHNCSRWLRSIRFFSLMQTLCQVKLQIKLIINTLLRLSFLRSWHSSPTLRTA